MIDKLLITYLHRNKRIIIPTLGALLRKNVEGVGVILVFVKFLNKDDGILLKAIESWAGVEREDAEIILKEYVECIRQSLDTRGQYIIEGIGILKYDANHVIYLAKEEPKAKEVAPVAPAVVVEPVATPVVEPTPVAVVEPVPVVVAPVMPTLPPEPVVPPAPKPEPIAEPEPVSAVEPPIVEPEPQVQEQPKRAVYGNGTNQMPDQRKNTLNNLYGGSRTTGAIYGSGSSSERGSMRFGAQRSTTQPSTTEGYTNAPQHGVRQGSSYGGGKPTAEVPPVVPPVAPVNTNSKQSKKRKVDMVMVIAAIAVVVTILSLLYAFFWGSETTLDDNIYIEQPMEQQPASDSITEDMIF